RRRPGAGGAVREQPRQAPPPRCHGPGFPDRVQAAAQRSSGFVTGRERRPRYLVDGMNLIGSRPDKWWNDPDRAVRRLVEELERYAAAIGDDVTVVFDRRPPDLDAGAHGPIEVAFASRRGRNAADHEIVRIVSEDPVPGSLVVV